MNITANENLPQLTQSRNQTLVPTSAEAEIETGRRLFAAVIWMTMGNFLLLFSQSISQSQSFAGPTSPANH